MEIRYFLLLLVVCQAKCDLSPSIRTFMEETNAITSPFSYYDYTLDEKTGRLVYAFCDAFDAHDQKDFKYMSCWVTLKVPVFLGAAFNKSCSAEFSSEPAGLLELLNKNYQHRHKIVLLNDDKVLLVKNSFRAGEPIQMELLIVTISDCSVRVVRDQMALEPHFYPNGNVFHVVHFESRKSPCPTSCYVRVTYDCTGRLVAGPVRYTFSDSINDKVFTFWEPLYIGSPREFSYLQTFDADSNGQAFHTLYKGSYSLNKTEELIKTDNAIVGTSMLHNVSSFCWLSDQNVISCRRYNSEGSLNLNVSGNFFNNSIPWETKVTVKAKQPKLELYKSRQLKLHNMLNGELLLVTINRICQITDDYLITQKKGFEVVKINADGESYTGPLEIKIQDEKYQNFRVFRGLNPAVAKNLYLPRVNVIEINQDICFATWWDSSALRRNKIWISLNFSMKCLSKSQLN